MFCSIVCISLTEQSDGTAAGQAVAAGLGFRYVDEEIITKAADLAGVEPERVAAAEQDQPLVARLLEMLSAAQSAIESVARAGNPAAPVAAPTEQLRELIRAAIHEIAKAGRVVIVAHGASMALAGTPGVLRVMITASEETRVNRLAERKMLTRVAANAAIEASDEARRTYFRNFYQVMQESPTHYDLVLNTETISPELATRIILTAARG